MLDSGYQEAAPPRLLHPVSSIQNPASPRYKIGRTNRVSFFVNRIHIRNSPQAGHEQFGVGFGCLEVVEQNFHCLDRRELGELPAQDVDARQFVGVVEEFLAARGGVEDLDGGVDALLDERAVEVKLHVARALEFLENQLV